MGNSVYLPLIGGGRRNDVEILSVSLPTGQGSVEVIGDVFRFTAGPDLKGQPFGIPLAVLISVRFLDEDGKDVTTIVPVLAINTPLGVALELPGGRTVQDTALLSPIPVSAMFDAPFTASTPKIETTIDESIFVQIFNAANPQFLEAFVSTQQTILEKSGLSAQANAAQEQAANSLKLVDDARIARAEANVFESQAVVLEQLLQGALDELAAANTAFINASVAASGAQVAAQQIADQLAGASARVDIFTAQFATATTLLSQKLVEIAVQLTLLGLPAPVEQHLDNPSFGAIFQNLVNDRDALQELSDTALASLKQAEADATQLTEEFFEAQVAVTSTVVALTEAKERLEAAADVEFEELEEAAIETRALADLRAGVAETLEAVVQDVLDVPVPINEQTYDAFVTALTTATTNKALADIALAEAQVAFEQAAEAYSAELEQLPDVEFTWDIFSAQFGLEANLGLEFSFNPPTEDDPFEAALALVYDIEIGLVLDSFLTIKDVFLGIDENLDVDLNDSISFSGRYEFDGSNRPSGERFAELADRLPERGERLADWSDSFDFL